MPGSFDAIKALKEEVAGVTEVRTALVKRERQLSAQLGELEVEHNTVVKLRGFADAELARKREVLRQLEEKGEGT